MPAFFMCMGLMVAVTCGTCIGQTIDHVEQDNAFSYVCKHIGGTLEYNDNLCVKGKTYTFR